MYRHKTLIRNIFTGINNAFTTSCKFFSEDRSLKMDKVLVVSKLSRYQYEKTKHKNLSDEELERKLRSSGVDFDNLMYYHKVHKEFESKCVKTLKHLGCEVEVVNRFNYSEDSVDWADVVMPVGGDGTFLLGASKVLDNKKPVIGFNSDTKRSEGHLCLPKAYSTDIKGAIERLRQGKFDWLYRSRIRTKVVKHGGDIICKSLHDGDYCSSKRLSSLIKSSTDEEAKGQVLPVLALNEVFVGEGFAARVSNLKLRMDGASVQTYVKCSGLCVSTGTGSTSWHMSINRLSVQDTCDLLNILDIDPTGGENSLATILSRIFNKNLIFPADDCHMAYSIRDKIVSVVWPVPRGIKTRGLVKKLEIKSHCYDAFLVVDGGVSFDFNDGTIAILETHPEDALKTVVFKD